jgi:flagellar protein FliS
MDQRAAADAYRRASIENAPPIKIVRMLYQGAVRFLQQAEEVDPSDPNSPFLDLLERADAIVTELRLSIDHTAGADMTADLERLYLFCEDELGRAGLERSTAPLPGVRSVLNVLLDAWQRVEVETSTSA